MKKHEVWNSFKKYLDQYTIGNLLTLDAVIAIFLEKYPRDFFHVIVDDEQHTASDLLFVLHRSNDEFHGTHMVSVPASGPPCTLFLYPIAAANLLQTIAKVNTECTAVLDINQLIT